MIRQGELAYAQHTFVPHGDAKYRCDPVWDYGQRGESRRSEDTQKAASAGHGPASSAQVPPEPELFKWGSHQQSNAWVRRPNVQPQQPQQQPPPRPAMEAEDEALKAEIKKLQQEAEAYGARVTMYEEVHTKTFNEDRAQPGRCGSAADGSRLSLRTCERVLSRLISSRQ